MKYKRASNKLLYEKSKKSFEEYWATRCIKQRNNLVVTNRGLARKIAIEISQRTSVSLEDLTQVADAALIQCVEKFDPSMGYKFSSFAVPILRGRLLNYIRDKGALVRIPRRYYDLAQQAKRVEKKLVGSLGRHPTDLEQAQEMGIEIDELIIAKRSIHVCQNTSDDESLNYLNSSLKVLDNESVKICCNNLNAQEKACVEFAFSKSLDKVSGIKQLGIAQAQFKMLVREAVCKAEISVLQLDCCK